MCSVQGRDVMAEGTGREVRTRRYKGLEAGPTGAGQWGWKWGELVLRGNS